MLGICWTLTQHNRHNIWILAVCRKMLRATGVWQNRRNGQHQTIDRGRYVCVVRLLIWDPSYAYVGVVEYCYVFQTKWAIFIRQKWCVMKSMKKFWFNSFISINVIKSYMIKNHFVLSRVLQQPIELRWGLWIAERIKRCGIIHNFYLGHVLSGGLTGYNSCCTWDYDRFIERLSKTIIMKPIPSIRK